MDKRIVIGHSVTVAEFAELLGVAPTTVIQGSFEALGRMVTIHEGLSWVQLRTLGERFGITVVRGPTYPFDDLGE